MSAEPVVWNGLTRAELDRACSPSSMIESIEPELAWYAERSAAVRAVTPPERISYGDHSDEWFHLWPAPEGNVVHAFVHGGYWQALSASDASFPASGFLAQGIGYASVNYSLAPHVSLDTIVDQVRRAFGYLTSHYRVIASGHSAGAHLVAMAAASVPLAAAVFLSGVFDLEPIRLSYVNDDLHLDAEAALRNSPYRHPAFCGPVPAIVAVGEHDTTEFHRQGAVRADALATHGNPEPVRLEVAGRNHFDLIRGLGDTDDIVGAVVAAQARSVRRRGGARP